MMECSHQDYLCLSPHTYALKHSIACSLSSFHRQTSLSSSSCSSLLSGSTTAPGSAHLRRLTLRAVSKHLLTLVSVESAVRPFNLHNDGDRGMWSMGVNVSMSCTVWLTTVKLCWITWSLGSIVVFAVWAELMNSHRYVTLMFFPS